MSANGGLPLVTDVTFRISDAGDFFAVDFTCADGEVRGVALPVTALTRLVAGLLWTGAESGRKRAPPDLEDEDVERLREHAPSITAIAAGRAAQGLTMAIQIGAVSMAVRLDPTTALEVAERLVDLIQGGPRAPLE